jgi:hypothetical protein
MITSLVLTKNFLSNYHLCKFRIWSRSKSLARYLQNTILSRKETLNDDINLAGVMADAVNEPIGGRHINL